MLFSLFEFSHSVQDSSIKGTGWHMIGIEDQNNLKVIGGFL